MEQKTVKSNWSPGELNTTEIQQSIVEMFFVRIYID